MIKTLGGVNTAMSSASGLEKMLGITRDEAINLRLAIRWIAIDQDKLVVQFYSGTPIAVARKLPNLFNEVQIDRILNGRPIRG
jgi:hypothetical protein